jgi:hypothetical protein
MRGPGRRVVGHRDHGLAIRGYISTIRKNGLRAATELENALLGKSWMPSIAA